MEATGKKENLNKDEKEIVDSNWSKTQLRATEQRK